MLDSALLSWALTLGYASVALYYLWRLFREPDGKAPTRPQRISSLAHLIMSVGMIPMLWWWGMRLPAVPQVVLFGLFGVWFLCLVVRPPAGSCCGRDDPRFLRAYHAHHFVLMAGMVWMLVAMAVGPMTSTSVESSMPGTHAGTEHTMDHDMDHSTDHAMDHSADVHATMSAHDHGESPAPIAVTSLVLGAYFLVITPWWLVEIVGVTRRRRRIGRLGPKRSRAAVQRAAAVEAGVHALKSAGMGVMLLVAL